MSIIYDERAKTFSLHTRNTTYQLKVGQLGYVEHLYYGERVNDADLSYLILQYDRGFSGQPWEMLSHRTFSLDARPQEFSTFQKGDFRIPALKIVNADGSRVFDGRYRSHRIYEGKYELEGLPGSFDGAKKMDGETADVLQPVRSLELLLQDPVTNIQVTLLYSVFEDADVITRAARVTNAGKATVWLDRAMSMNLDFRNGADFDLLSLPGRYGFERQPERQKLTHQVHRIRSDRGSSSHQQNPFAVLCDHTATEDQGRCFGFALLYSGSFTADIELDQFDQVRIQMGISDHAFHYPVEAGNTFTCPEVLLTYTGGGLSGLSHIFHDFFREHMNPGKFVKARRPVLLNTWEGVYMDFNEEKILEIARGAKKMGVELLVLDDGWFGKRDDDNSGLGDWYVNEQKLRGGLPALIHEVNALGLDFGIWIEPEMISEDSDLYRAHPDWAMQIPGRNAVRSRNQLLLDLTREDVQEYIVTSISRVLECGNIRYVKWDFNRSVTDLWSNVLAPHHQGEVSHRLVLGVYKILDGIIRSHPDIMFEGCSGGGGRMDPAMLCFFTQYWTSDNTRPLDDLRLHYGTSFLYPLCTMGAHVAVGMPYVPIQTKAMIARCGTFGYELDPAKLSEEELAICREQSRLYHEYYDVNFYGDYYRLTGVDEQAGVSGHGSFVAWETVTKDQSMALISIVTTRYELNGPQEYLRLKGLDPDAMYQVEGLDFQRMSPEIRNLVQKDGKIILSGAALMHAGIPVTREVPEYTGIQVIVKRWGRG